MMKYNTLKVNLIMMKLREEIHMDIKLSDEQQVLFEEMEQTRQHLFITGRAGAGKSVLLRHFREQTKKRVVIAAPTGIAALNVRGQTIHSLFKLPPQLYRKGSLSPNTRLRSLLKRIDCLVIDEISMVRADIMDAIDERLREATGKDTPFGGVQVIMFGDVYQLPPVVEENLTPYFEAVHGGHFFFNGLVWKQAEFKIYELTQVFRQKDPIFKDILNAVRDGTVIDCQIDQLNGRYGAAVPAEGVITLAPTNNLVTAINQKQLDQLPGQARQYQATITGEMKRSVFPTEEQLQLKEGAQVVLLKNDKDARWVNGTVGKIEKLFDDHIDVKVGSIVYTLDRETWEEVVYSYDQETQKVEAHVSSSFTQYPIRLAWALTIHKSQGQTYESVALDLTTATFAAGQLYVALSRCTSLEGLYLKMPVKREHIIVDAKVTAFMLRQETIKVEVAQVEEPQEVVIAEPEQTKAVAVLDIRHDEITDVSLIASNVKIEEIQDGVVFHHDAIEGEIILEVNAGVATPLQEGKVSHIVAIEVLCPFCGTPCVDRGLESPMITYELVGHAVICPECKQLCIVPLNAFSLQGDVIAREQPKGTTNARREKKGRTKKEKKSTKGRKTKSGVVREPMQLSLDVRTIQALTSMGVNKSQLFEDLLQQYEPFLEAYAAIDTGELDHDEIESEE
jgi:ATP-dependent DNA helicase PIF1